MVDTGAGDGICDESGDSDADSGDTWGGGRAADQTFRGHFGNRSHEEAGNRNTLPG